MALSTPELERSDDTGRADEEAAVELNQPQDPAELPLDVVFDLLSNQRRRQVLLYLESVSDPTTLSDLAEHIASIENDKPERALSSAERKRVYICLYQCHLPKLDDAGVVDFDEHRKSVTVGPQIDALRQYLPERVPVEPRDPSAKYYLGLSLAGAAALGVQSVVAPAGWATGILLGILLVTVCATAYDRLRRGDRSTDKQAPGAALPS